MPVTTQHLIAGNSFTASSRRRDDSHYLGEPIRGRVVRVVDADTILVRYTDYSGIDSVRYVRAANTNAPEIRSIGDNRALSELNKIERNQYYYGDLAANRLREILRSYNNEILLRTDQATDVHNRQVAGYYTPSGQSIERILAEEGLTLYKTNQERFSGTNPVTELAVLQAQQKAQKEGLGIFSEGLYLPPDEFLAQTRKRRAIGADVTLGSLIDNAIGLIKPKHRFERYISETNKLEERLRLLSALEGDIYTSRLDQLRQQYGDETAKLVDPITYYKAQAFRRNTDYETYVYANSRRNIFGEDRITLRTPIYGDTTSRVFESLYQAKRVALGYELLDTKELPGFIIELDKRRAMLSPVERANREVFNNLDSTISPHVALSIGLGAGTITGMASNVALEALSYNLSNYGTLTDRAFARQAQSIGKTLTNNRGRLAGATIIGLITGTLLTAYLSNRNTQEVLNLGYSQEHNHKRLLFDNPSDSLTKDLYMAVVNRLDALINGLNVGSRGTNRTTFGNIREQPKRDSTILKTTLESLFDVTQDLILGTAIYYGLMVPAQQAIQNVFSGVFQYTLASFGGVDRIRSTPVGSSILALQREIVGSFRRAQAQNAFLGLFGRIGAASGLDINIITPVQGGVVSKSLIRFDNFDSFSEFVSRIDSQLINPAEHMKVYGADPTAYSMPDASGLLRTTGFRFGGPGRQVSFTVNKDRLWEGFVGKTKEQKLASAQKFADALNDLFSIVGYENYGNLQLSSGLSYSAEQLLGSARDQLKQAQIQKAMSQVYANPLRWLGVVPVGTESTEVSMAAVFGSTGFISRTVGYAVGRPPVLHASPASSTIKTTFDELKYIINRFMGVATPEQLQSIKSSRNILTTRAMLMHRGASAQDLEQVNDIISAVVRDPKHPTDQISSLLLQTRSKTSFGTKLARAGASALVYGLLFSYMFKTSTGLDATTQFGDAIAQLGLEFPVPNGTSLINIGWSSTSVRVRDSETGEIREEERTPWFNRLIYSAFAGYAVFSYFAFEGQASILKAGAAQVLGAIPGAKQIPTISTFIRNSFDEYFQQAGLKTALNQPMRAADFTDLTALLKHGPNFTQKLTASKVLAGRGARALLGAAGTLTAISLIAGLFNSISYSMKVASLGGMYQEGAYVDPTLQARLKYLWGVYQDRYFESPTKQRTRGLAPIYTYNVMQMLGIDSAQQGESQGIPRQAGTQQIGSIYATTLFGYDITRNRMRFTTGMQLPLYTMGTGFDLPVQIILDKPTATQLQDQQRDVSAFRYPVLPYIGDNSTLVPIAIPFTGGRTGRFTYVASSTLAEFYKSYAAIKVGYAFITVPAELLKMTGTKVISTFDSIASQILARNQSTIFNTVADSITATGEVIGGTLYTVGEHITDNIFVKLLKGIHDLAKFTLDVSTPALKSYLSQGSRLVGQFRYSLAKSSKQALERFLTSATQNSAAQVGNVLQNSTPTLTKGQLSNITKGIGNIAVSTYLGELVGQQVFGVEGVGGAIGLTVSLLQTIHSIEVTRQVNKFIRTDPRFAAQAGMTNLDDIAIANTRAAIETKAQALRASTKIGGVIPRPTTKNLGVLAMFAVGATLLYGAFENSNRRVPNRLRLPEGAYRFSIDLTAIPGYQALTTRKAIFRYTDGTEVERRIPRLFNLPTGGIYLPQKIDVGQALKQLTGVSDSALDFYSAKARLRAYNTYGDPIADLIDPSVLGPRVDYTRDRNLISIFTRPFKILSDRTYFGNTLTDASGGGGIHLGLGGVTARQYDGNVYAGSSYMQFQGAVSDISFAENIMKSAFTPGLLQSVLGDSALMLINDQVTFTAISDGERDTLIAGLIFAGLPTKPLPKPRQFSPILHRSVYRILSGNRATSAALSRRNDYLAWLANANQLDLAMMYNRTPYRKDVDEEGKSAGFLPGFSDGFSFFVAGALRFSNYFTSPMDRRYGRSLESTFYEGIEITGRDRSLVLAGQDIALGPAKTIGLLAGTAVGTLIGISVGTRVLDRAYQASGRGLTRNMGILNSTYANLNALIPETAEHLVSAARMAQISKVGGLVSESGTFNITIGGARQLSYTIPGSTINLSNLTKSIEKGQTVIGTILSERQRILTNFWGRTNEEGLGGLLNSVKGAPNSRQVDVLIKQLNELKKNLTTPSLGLISNEQLTVINDAIGDIARLNNTNIDTVQNLLINSFGIDSKLTAELASSVDDVLSAAQNYKIALDSKVAKTIQPVSQKLASSMNTLASKLRMYSQTILDQIPIQSVGHFGAGMSLTDRVVEVGTAGLAKRTEDLIGAVPISTRPPSVTGDANLLNATRNKLAAARQSFNRLVPSSAARSRVAVATKTTTRVFGTALTVTPYALAALKSSDLLSDNVAPTRAARGTVESAEAVGQYAVTAFLLNKLLALTSTGLTAAAAYFATLLGGSMVLGGLAVTALGIAAIGAVGYVTAETGIDKDKNFSLFHALGKAFDKASRKRGHLGTKGQAFLGSLWESLGDTAEVIFRRAGQGIDYLTSLELPFTGGYSYKVFRRDAIQTLANLSTAVKESVDEGDLFASGLTGFMTRVSDTRETVAVAAYRRYKDINRRMAEGNSSLLENIEAITFGIITNNLLTPSNPLILMDMQEVRDRYRYFSPFVPAGGDLFTNRIESLLPDLADQLDYGLGNADMSLISALTYGIPNQRPNSVEGLRNSALLSSSAGVQRIASRFRPISMVTQATALQLEIRSQLAAQVFADSHYRALYINRNLDNRRFFTEERIPEAIFPEGPNYKMRYRPPRSHGPVVRGIIPPPPPPPPSGGFFSGPSGSPLPGAPSGFPGMFLSSPITQGQRTIEGAINSVARILNSGSTQSTTELQQEARTQSRVRRRPTKRSIQQSQVVVPTGTPTDQYRHLGLVGNITSYSRSNVNLLSPTVTNRQVERQVSRQVERQVPRQITNIGVVDSGLVTGPAGVIGAGAAYHIDTKFPRSLPIEKRVALFDAIAIGYRAQGRVVEFSNSAVSGLIYNPDAPFEERARLLQRAEAAHSHSVHAAFTSIDYYTPKQGSNRFEDTSLRGGPLLVPTLPGLTLSYGSGSGYGSYVVGIDPEGNILYKSGHGDSRQPLPANRTISSEQPIGSETITVIETVNERVVENIQEKDIRSAVQGQINRILGTRKQTVRPTASSESKVPFDLAFLNKARQVAGNLGMNPDHLLAIISFESAGTFRSDIQNPRSLATGLIQFIPSTAVGLGYTLDELKAMTPYEQLDVVEKYLQPYKGRLNTLESAYMAVLYPAAIGSESSATLFEQGTRVYSQNIGLDLNKDGVITVGEAASSVLAHLGLVQAHQANLMASEDSTSYEIDVSNVKHTKTSFADSLGFPKPNIQTQVKEFVSRKSLEIVEQAFILTEFAKDRLDFIDGIVSGSITFEEFLDKPSLTVDELRLLDQRRREDKRNPFQKLLGLSMILGTIIGGGVLSYKVAKAGIGALENVRTNLKEKVTQLNEIKKQKRALRESLINEQSNEQFNTIFEDPQTKVSDLARQRLQAQRIQTKRKVVQARTKYRFNETTNETFKSTQSPLDLYPTELGPSPYGVSSRIDYYPVELGPRKIDLYPTSIGPSPYGVSSPIPERIQERTIGTAIVPIREIKTRDALIEDTRPNFRRFPEGPHKLYLYPTPIGPSPYGISSRIDYYPTELGPPKLDLYPMEIGPSPYGISSRIDYYPVELGPSPYGVSSRIDYYPAELGPHKLDLYPTELGPSPYGVSSLIPERIQDRISGTAIIPIREIKTRDALIEDTRPNFRRFPEGYSRSGPLHTRCRGTRPYVFRLPANRNYSALSFIRAVSSAIDPTVDAAKILNYEVMRLDPTNTHTTIRGQYSSDPKIGLGIIRLARDLDERLSQGRGLENKTDLEILVHEIGHHHYRAKGLYKQAIEKSSLELHIRALFSVDFGRIMSSTREYKNRIKELKKAGASRNEIDQAKLNYRISLHEELFAYNFGKKYRSIAADLYNQLKFHEKSILITPVKHSDIQTVIPSEIQTISEAVEIARSNNTPVSAQSQSTIEEITSSIQTGSSLVQIPTHPVSIINGSEHTPTVQDLTPSQVQPIQQEITAPTSTSITTQDLTPSEIQSTESELISTPPTITRITAQDLIPSEIQQIESELISTVSTPIHELTPSEVKPITEEIVNTELLNKNALNIANRLERTRAARIEGKKQTYFTDRYTKKDVEISEAVKSANQEYVSFSQDLSKTYSENLYNEVLQLVKKAKWQRGPNRAAGSFGLVEQALSISKPATVQAVSDLLNLRIAVMPNVWGDLGQPLSQVLMENYVFETGQTLLIGHGAGGDPSSPNEFSWYTFQQELLNNDAQLLVTVSPVQPLITQLDAGLGVFCYICNYKERVNKFSVTNPGSVVSKEQDYSQITASLHYAKDIKYEAKKTEIMEMRKRSDVNAPLPKYIIVDTQAQAIDVALFQPKTPVQLLNQDLDVPNNTLRSQTGVSYRGRGRSIATKSVRSPKATNIKARLINKSTQVLRNTEITVTEGELHLTLKEGARIIADLKTSDLVAHDLTHLITGYDFTPGSELKAVEWEMNQFTKDVSDLEVDIYDSLYKVPGEVKMLLLGGYKKLGVGSKFTINFYGDRFDIDYNYIATDDRSSLSTPYNIGNNRYTQQNPTSPLQHTWDMWVELLGNRNNIRDTTGYSGLSRTYTKAAARNRITYDLVTKLPEVGLQPSELATKKNQLLQLADQLGIKVYLNEDFTRQGLKSDVQGFYRQGGEVHLSSGLSPELEVRVLAHELRHATQDIQGKLTGNLDKPTKPGGASRRTIFERQAEGAQGNVDITIRRLEKLTKRFPTQTRKGSQQRNRIVSLTGSTPLEYNNFTPQTLYKTEAFTSTKRSSFTALEFVRELSRTIDPTINTDFLDSVSPVPYAEFGEYQLGEYYREEGAASGSIRVRQDLYDRLSLGLATAEDLEIVTHELGHLHFDFKGRAAEIAHSTLEDVERAVNTSPFRDRIMGSVAELKGEVRVYINQLDLSDPRQQELAEGALDVLKVKMYDEFVTYPFGQVFTELAQSVYDKFDFFNVGEAAPTLYSRNSVSTLSSKTTEQDVSNSIVKPSKSIDEQTAYIRQKNLNRFNKTSSHDLLESDLVKSNKTLSNNDLPKNADTSQSTKIQGSASNRQLPLTQSNQKNAFGDYKHSNKYPVKGSLDFVNPVASPPPVLDLNTLGTRFELTGGDQYNLQTNPMVSQPIGITGQRYTFSNDFALPSVATVPNAVVDNAQAFRTGSGFVGSVGNAYDISGTIAGAAQQVFDLNTEQTFGVGVATGALYLAGSSGLLGDQAGAGIVAAVEGQAVMGSTVIGNAVTRNLQLGGAAVPITTQGAAIAGALYAGDSTRATQQQLITSTSAVAASLVAGKLYSSAVASAAASTVIGPKGLAVSALLLVTGLVIQMSAGTLVGQAVGKAYLQGALNDTLRQTPRYYDQNAVALTGHQRRRTPRQDRIGSTHPARVLANAEDKLNKDIREIYSSVQGSVEVLIKANLEANIVAIDTRIQNLAGTRNRSQIREGQRLGRRRTSLVNGIENNLDKLTDDYINTQVQLLKHQIALDDKPVDAVRNALIDATHSAYRINEAARDLTNLNNQAEEERLSLIRGIVLSSDQEILRDGYYPGLSDYLAQQMHTQQVQQQNKVAEQEKELQEQSNQSNQNTNSQRQVNIVQPDLGNPRDVRTNRGRGTIDPATQYTEPTLVAATKAAIVQVSPAAAAFVAATEVVSNLIQTNIIENVQTFFRFNRGKEQVMNSDPAIQNSNPNSNIDPANH